MKDLRIIFSLLILVIISASCKKELPKIEPTDDLVNMADLVIPDDFHFETSKQVEVTFVDFKASKSNEIKYSIYLYSDETTSEVITFEDEDGEMVTETIQLTDVHNNLVTTVISNDENFLLNLIIPEYYNYLYIVRNEMGVYTSQIIPVENNKASFGGFKSVADDPVDVIYGVNGQGDVFTLNPETGDFVVIDEFPNVYAGAQTCALDPISRTMYTISKSTKDLLAYDIDNNTWEVRGNTGLKGPRLEYRKEDGLLYFSTTNKVMTINPENGTTISTYTVVGLHEGKWGDVAFDTDGIFYMATGSGLYRCDPSGNNTFNAVRISAENLPFTPTSMTFDSNGELWLGSNDGSKGRVAVMDKVTGGWEYRYENLPVRINDLTYLPLDENDVEETDTDGDGVIDFYDEYPNDAQRAYNTYTPSIYGWGSYAFEDLWPNDGDYDFNDLVVNYRYISVANANNDIVETKLIYKVKNVGGSFHNGFGLELDMEESLIAAVSGYNHTEGIVSLNGKGLENGQAKPVLIAFDDAWDNFDGQEMELLITYTNPILPELVGSLNPFIFVNGDRGREVHFSDMAPTSLANADYFGTEDDNSDLSIGRYYKTENNLPWGINIIHDFVFLKEKSAIVLGYNKFAEWAESGGQNYPDWYKDQNGYRNDAYLEY